jgi:putative RNA 2'-phosphotransferase
MNTINDKTLTSLSKLLSLTLRHKPETLGLALDENGWVEVDALIAGARAAGKPLDLALLREIVETNNKQRFAFSEDGLRIRANQGHTVEVALDLPPVTPPETLLHGTATRFLDAILAEGLDKRQRHHVHLSESPDTARQVGARYGKVVLLEIEAGRMHRDGHQFFKTENGVWLTDAVPTGYLKVIP